MNRSVIGFDRRLELPWLELAAAVAAEELSPGLAKPKLLEGLRGLESRSIRPAGEEPSGDRQSGVMMANDGACDSNKEQTGRTVAAGLPQVGKEEKSPPASVAKSRDKLLNSPTDGALSAAVHLEQAVDDAGDAARLKSAGVLMRLWIRVPPERRAHRDRGLALLQGLQGAERLWIHWGIALATYPFFQDIATQLGKTLALQETCSLSLLTQRMGETWGERSTVRRALQRVVRSMVSWGALLESGEVGMFCAPVKTRPPADVAAWLIEATLRGSGSELILLQRAGSVPCLFPFQIELTPRDLRALPGVELHREGMDRDVVTLRV